jgi:hypothetical protein
VRAYRELAEAQKREAIENVFQERANRISKDVEQRGQEELLAAALRYRGELARGNCIGGSVLQGPWRWKRGRQ